MYTQLLLLGVPLLLKIGHHHANPDFRICRSKKRGGTAVETLQPGMSPSTNTSFFGDIPLDDKAEVQYLSHAEWCSYATPLS